MIPTFSTWLIHKELGSGKLPFDEALKFISGPCGATSIEIPRTTYSDWSVSGQRNLKRMLHKHGLFCAAIAAQNHFNCPTHIERRREVQLTKDFIDVASFVGARVLNVFHAGWGDREQGRRLKNEMLECMKDVVAYAEQKSVILAVEAHGPITDNAVEFKEFMNACSSEYLRVNLDTGNMSDGPEGNLQLLEFTAHVHVKSKYRDLQKNVHDAQVTRVLGELKKTGYCGTATFEDEGMHTYEELPRAFGEFKTMLSRL
jgi:sugar phosphate isomerase/epimerase